MTANTFLALGDTPSSYIGERLKFLRVNNNESGVTFTNVELNDLVDVEANGAYTPQTGQGLIYSAAAGVWRPSSLDVYSAGNGISKSALTINVLAGPSGGLTANTQGVFITPIANVAGTYGSDLLIPVVTVNNKGQVTNVTTRAANVQTAYNLAADYVGNVNGTLGQISVTGGRGNNSNATINLVATGVTAGTYGNSTTIPRITVDTYGRIQNIDSVAASGGGGDGSGTTLGFANIVIEGQTTVSADQVEDSVTFVAGTGTTITTSANADTITFGVNAAAVANNISISDLTDVGPLDGIVNGQVLIWNSVNNRFQIGFTGGGGGAATVISSETPPIGPQDATLWYDQISGRLYIYYDGFWVDAAPASSFNANITNPASGQVLKYNGTEWVNQTDTGTVDLSNFAGNIIPSANSTYTLGNATRQWKELWVSNSTIYIGGVPIRISESNTLIVGDSDDATSIATENYVIDAIANMAMAPTWSSITGKPTFANVATSGSYNDLSNKPSIPTNTNQLVNGNGFITSSALSGYATESYVTTSINNLVNGAPAALNTLNELAAALGNNSSFATSVTNSLANKANIADLANVATSGSYFDLNDAPRIPVDVSDLTDNNSLLGGGGGATTLSALTDVALEGPVEGSVLTWNDSQNHWENRSLPTASEIINTDGDSNYSVSVGTDGVITMVTSRGNLEFGALPEPGGPTHFHIMRPAGQEGSSDIFFGDDYNYTRLRASAYGQDPGYGVEIGTNDMGSGDQHVWRFETDGTLTLPAGGDIKDSDGNSVLGGGSNTYTPEEPEHWNEPTVTSVAAALDELAARLTAIQNYEIDGGNAYTPAQAELLIDGNNGA